MNVIEFIGFIISMIALFVLLAKQAKAERKRKLHPEESFQDDPALQEILKSLEPEEVEDEEKQLPSPPPIPKRAEVAMSKAPPAAEGSIFKDHWSTQTEQKHDQAYALRKGAHAAGVSKWLKKRGSLREAMLLREILGPPKCVNHRREQRENL